MFKYSAKVTRSPFGRRWKRFIGIIVVMLGVAILLINLSGQNTTPTHPSTPVIVRDGLVVTANGLEFYIFKKYTLHKITKPTPYQQTQAHFVADAFLTQYTRGEPVDALGLPAPQAVSSQFPNAQPKTILPAAMASRFSKWIGGMLILTGGIWLLAYLFRDYQIDQRSHLTTYLRQTAVYTTQIEQILKANPNRKRQQLLTQIHHWKQAIEELVWFVDNLYCNDLIQHDLASVPYMIDELKQQLDIETHPTLRTHKKQMLTQRENQLIALEQVQIFITQAEMQVETTVAALGTIYSQLLTNQSTIQATDFGRLLTRVEEEVQCLQDHLEALREVKVPSI